MDKSDDHIKLEAAYRELQVQLEEANDIIQAIRSGEVDALVVNGKDGHQLFTLKSADQSYRIFIEQMIESAITIDQAGRILYCNSQFAALCQRPLETIIGKEFASFVSDEQQNFAREIIEMGWEVDTKAELFLLDKDADKIAVQLSIKQLKLDEGVALSVIITDLTNLKKAQHLLQSKNQELEAARKFADKLNDNLERIVADRTQELEQKNIELTNVLNDLKESEDNLHSAFNAGELGSYSLDLRTGKAEMSPKFRELYGLPSQGEINWKMVLSAIDPLYLDELNEVLERCIKTGSPVDSTYPITHLSSGERRWMRMVGKCKIDAEGNFKGVYAVLMDVTAQKQDEQRKNDFIAMVSHELKTPLTSIKGYIQVLQLKAKQEHFDFAGKALDGADRQIGKMTKMINGFLNMARLESGKISMDFSILDLNELVETVLEDHKSMSLEHRINFVSGDQLIVRADEDKLSQVVNNLISNAVKYSPNQTEIYIECYNDGKNVVFKITDQGMGISQVDLPRLFDRFYRVENLKTSTVSGFGIGLYLSAEIIERHNGKIWVESEVGKGSKFYFSLPSQAQM